MADLFSEAWMKRFGEEWNKEAKLTGDLAKINFASTIAYGFAGEAKPRGFIQVQNGQVVASGVYAGQTLNWDLRASPENWQKWIEKGLGMMALGMAYTTGKMKFQVGDYGAMIKEPRMAGPFIESFSVMGRV
ncbi:conserved hypothetical protein [Gammaproteobacteria bacterium]